ncbi:TadE family type IV pilus minor pilin [Paenarthrobacter sp. S56]|uniref:TadE family type IV pilus minor pilin n=1 Tax=Paenarthrobacter sp. S56 TaxID=3138179 RepID=UPI00321C18CA
MALPAVVLVLALLLAGGAAGITQLRLEEAARAGARALARGDAESSVQGIVQRIAGPEAHAGVESGGDWRTVTAASRAGGALGALIPWTLAASASAKAETTNEVVTK